MIFKKTDLELAQSETWDEVIILGTNYIRTMIEYANNKKGVKYEAVNTGRGLFISTSKDSFYCAFIIKGLMAYTAKDRKTAFEYALRGGLINVYLEALSDLKIQMSLPLTINY